ncbi:MAG: hypothetical protein MUP24_09885 [Gillisia sp.]|nr:hypothetical protein [Gillisia sp.]
MLLSKIILFYSVFYIVMKVFAVLFENVWVLPNLILAIPFLIFAILGGMMLKRNNYSWIYAIAGILVIGLIRYYEAEWVVNLHEYLNQ